MVDITVSSVGTIGEGINYGGYAISATGVGAEVGLPMVVLGNALTAISGYTQAGIDYCRGSNNLGTSRLVLTSVGAVLPSGVLSSSKFSAIEKVGVSAWVDGTKAILEKSIYNSSSKK